MSINSQREIPLIDGWREVAGDWTKKDTKIVHEANVISADSDKLNMGLLPIEWVKIASKTEKRQ